MKANEENGSLDPWMEHCAWLVANDKFLRVCTLPKNLERLGCKDDGVNDREISYQQREVQVRLEGSAAAL